MKTPTEISSLAKFVGDEKAIELIAKAGFDAWDFSMFDMCRFVRNPRSVFATSHPLSGAGYLSEDDGFTWKHKKVIDARMDVSYPDIDFYDGRIYLIYDRERTAAREILFTSFTEEDIMNDDYKFNISIVSKVEER